MSRDFILGIFTILLIAGAVMYFYRTSRGLSEFGNFGGMSLRIEYALTEEEKEKGLSGRSNLPSDYGMLFTFATSDKYGFWMKDTLVPLDIFWLDSRGQVVSMVLEVSTTTYPDVFYPSVPARYVLETSAGLGRARNIATGTPLVLKKFPTVSK